jgi:hypothetical protein
MVTVLQNVFLCYERVSALIITILDIIYFYIIIIIIIIIIIGLTLSSNCDKPS